MQDNVSQQNTFYYSTLNWQILSYPGPGTDSNILRDDEQDVQRQEPGLGGWLDWHRGGEGGGELRPGRTILFFNFVTIIIYLFPWYNI